MGAVPPYSYNDIVSQYTGKFKAQFAEKHPNLHPFFMKIKKGGSAAPF